MTHWLVTDDCTSPKHLEFPQNDCHAKRNLVFLGGGRNEPGYLGKEATELKLNFNRIKSATKFLCLKTSSSNVIV